MANADTTRSIDVPPSVWARGSRPFRGQAVRVLLAGVLVSAALLSPTAVAVGLGVLAAVILVAQPRITDRMLGSWEQRVEAASRSDVSKLLNRIDGDRLIALFAPHAWVALQKGRLHLKAGEGRAAAKSFADCGRMAGAGETPALVSAQAHALVVAGDRKQARSLLHKLEQGGTLSARGQLDLGISMLSEGGRHGQALRHIEAAHEVLGDEPPVLVARALALERTGDPAAAAKLVEGLDDDGGYDPLTEELLKRVRKALRKSLEPGRKEREATPRRKEEAPRRKAKTRKDRRKERRDKRRAAKRGKARDAPQPDEGPDDEGVDEPAAVPGLDSAEQDEIEPPLPGGDEEASRDVGDDDSAGADDHDEDADDDAGEDADGDAGDEAGEAADAPVAARPAAPVPPMPAAPAAPPPVGTFKPPPLPPPPAVGPNTKKAPAIAPPNIAPARATPTPDDAWGDVLGDDD